MKRFGSAAWNGGLREGKDRSRPRAAHWKPEKPGTNPEELPEAAHAACFKACAHSAHQQQSVHPKPWRLEMPFVTFTVRRGLSAADKSRLSEAMLEAQVAAGYHRADRFHRFLEVDRDDLLVDPRFPDYATDRTDRFMVVEVVISSGRPTGTAATIADEAVRLFGERLHLAPQDILFVFHEVEPSLPRFPLLRRSGERPH